jgi:hypothetical protein
MSEIILDDETLAKLKNSGTVRNAKGEVVAYLYSPEEHRRAVLDRFWAESETPEAKAQHEEALEAYRRGECLTTDQLNAEIAAFLKAKGAA